MRLCLKNPADSWIDGRWRCSVWKERLGGWVYTVSRRSLEERGEVMRDHVCPMCEACFDVLMCGCRLRSRDKSMGF